MASNQELIQKTYFNTLLEDARCIKSRANSFEFYYTKKFASEYITPNSSVIEIGCATGYYGMHFANKCKQYVGIDLSPENITAFTNKIERNQLQNVKAMLGDATNLKNIKNASFDVVMALGPMYHLPPEERELVFLECKRICKDNGTLIFAYINKVGAYIRGCLLAPDKYPNKQTNEFVLRRGIDDIRPDLFFFTMPEEIEERAKNHGLTILKNVGVDFVFNEKQINEMGDEQLEAWMELSDYICNSKTCTGVSNHAILICRK